MTNSDITTMALLIDANTTSPKFAPALLSEITQYGVVGVRRIYTDWTIAASNGWKEFLALYAIQPMQQYTDSPGRNAADGALIIDAMDLLHTGRFSGFLLVSSDDSLARLALRIRQQGVMVYGFGERHTPRSFITACDRFVYLDTREPSSSEPESVEPQDAGRSPLRALIDKRVMAKAKEVCPPPGQQRLAKQRCRFDDPVFDEIAQAVYAIADQDGRATLGAVGTQILKQMPGFDVRDYGYAKLSDLAEDCFFLEVERVGDIMQAITVRLVSIHSDVPIPMDDHGRHEDRRQSGGQ
ncbi:NYN domain-containing protein [Neorhizobium sp. BT27B]|jgi:hypothetical protein|uniref:NYN domain-containing protein n=1 Tax=Neorhizobium sp. BT27B TaxID=3142625 RepID=UPI003D2CFAFF